MKSKHLAVVGGGASGISAALEAIYADNSIKVTVFERLPKAAKKILATGNGRCNFTNEDLSPRHFYGEISFLRKVLTSPFADDESFFRSLGILSYGEDGRIYPRSQQASAIRDALLNNAEEYGVTIKLDTGVEEIKKAKSAFTVNGSFFDAVIVAGGGKASPVHGSDGSCFAILKNMGHSITPLYPALCGLTTDDKNIKMLKGVRAEGKASLFSGKILLGNESGEIQFTDKAVSGIPVMNLSHLVKNKKGLTLILDLCEDISEAELFEHIKSIKATAPDRELETVLSGIVNTKLGFAVMNKANIKPRTTIGQVTAKEIENLCDILKNFDISIVGTRDFDNAQITCGGVKTDEVFPETMMSKKHDGLFICGELLDIHGDCGGYNLHLAWTTGRIAGSSAAEYLKSKG